MPSLYARLLQGGRSVPDDKYTGIRSLPPKYHDEYRRRVDLGRTPAPAVLSDMQSQLGGLQEPWIDPVTIALSAGTGGAYAGLRAGMPVAKALGRGAVRGMAAGAADYPIGLATDEVAKVDPRLALPVNILLGAGHDLNYNKIRNMAKVRPSYPNRDFPDRSGGYYLEDPDVNKYAPYATGRNPNSIWNPMRKILSE